MSKDIGTQFSNLPVTFGSGKTKLMGKVLLPNTKYPVPGAILCHGLGASYQDMEPSALILASHGIAVLIFDFHGHGDSGGVLDGNIVEDVVNAWHFLSEFPEVDKRRIALVGHSMGAMAAILASRQILPYTLIALSCPPGSLTWWLTRPLAMLSHIWSYITGYHQNVNWWAFLATLWKMKMPTALHEVRNCSTLFVHCRGDSLTPYQKAVQIYEKANQPKNILLAEGGFHSAPLQLENLSRQWIQWAVATLTA